MSTKYEGGCLCGAVRYVAEVAPINERICHCRLCQKAIGASFNARLLFHCDDVSLTGPVATVHSSPELKRGFCQECGTSLYSERIALRVRGITAGSLDDPSKFQPTMHIWTSSKQPWVRLDDGLQQYEQAPPPA